MAMPHNKIFNDAIHGTISMEPFLVEIIDTPEFQRLRHIKQLGGTYHVYPEAQHNRFEHSIGTAHLAGKLVTHLKSKQHLHINDKDILCVKVAGLCHDLGHGPFSHLFDADFLPKRGVQGWAHEKGSCDLFDRIISRIDPHKNTLSAEDREFIRELINGKEMKTDWTHKGRTVEKSFLYDIISNKTNGVDVDKWDYFARDCHHLGIAIGFDHNRLIECTKVLEVEIGDNAKRRRICFRDKVIYDLYEMFHTRISLHRKACRHKAVTAVQMMICDAMFEADPYIEIPKSNGGKCSMSESIKLNNLEPFCQLDDRILRDIEHSPDQNLASARKILTRLSTGDRYRCIGSKRYQKPFEQEITDLQEEIRRDIEKRLFPKHEGTIKVSLFPFNYGKGKLDPISFCRFYSKENPDIPKEIAKDDVSAMLPSTFEENWIQVFCTKERVTRAEVSEAKLAFEDWYRETFAKL